MHVSGCWTVYLLSVLLGVGDLVFRQLFRCCKPAPAVTHVWTSVAVLDEVVGQFRRSLELHVAPAAVEQLDGNNTVHLDRIQFRSRLYVCIEMLGELGLNGKTLVADFALIRQTSLHGCQ